MALESKLCKAALHQHGKATIHTLSHAVSTSYRTARTREEELAIPSPGVFDFDQHTWHPRGDAHRLPTVAACAAHLQLLEVLYVLRQKILVSEDIDRAMGIAPNREEKVGHHGDRKTLKDGTLWSRRQKKWSKFVEFAAVRFLAWRRVLERRPDRMAVETDDGYVLVHVPPLDVIMVWHSFMLNPRLFSQTCKDGLLYKIRMPWKAIHDAIGSREWTFGLGSVAEAQFEANVGVPADLFDQFSSWMKQDDPRALGLTRFVLSADENSLDAVVSAASTGELIPAKYTTLFRSVDAKLAVALRDAVERQAEFVDKMNAHMWIRSPALEGTIRRGVDRYGKFLDLLRLYDGTTIVPTLDIDLVWHTHQCAAAFYARGMRAIVGRFVNHDDTIVKEQLGTGFDLSQRLFQVHFGRQYRLCGCWDCEALLSALEDAARLDAGEVDMGAVARRAREEVTYYRAVEVARRAKKPLPLRS
ncbi:Glycine-rich domain-containing protein 2 [Tolypocladium paradoxum]|uniref:Glycine-rich domain-containing protein 2 n=1 Tax=Tolypocladium paradoxum TaxID=94208 RepID=A0A2S4L1F7_9HYPO|nr:Glycine-rich domain-containing protein 2 [Tolypocladium paradoxum]